MLFTFIDVMCHMSATRDLFVAAHFIYYYLLHKAQQSNPDSKFYDVLRIGYYIFITLVGRSGTPPATHSRNY